MNRLPSYRRAWRDALRIAYYQAKENLICRRIGHNWRENVSWVAGQRCSSIDCRRCRTIPAEATAPAAALADPDRAHQPVPERALRAHLAGFPQWLTDECLAWTREKEARGWQFTGSSAAATHWLQHAQQHGSAGRTRDDR
jgi:hypothetical protein